MTIEGHKMAAHNSTFSKGGVYCSKYSFEALVFQFNFVARSATQEHTPSIFPSIQMVMQSTSFTPPSKKHSSLV